MEGIRYWIETEGTGHWFFIAFPIVLCCLFIWFKGRRVRFLIPSLLISIIIVNPWFYKYWDKLGLYAYWRVLWIVPIIPILASVIPSLAEKVEKSWIKTIVAGIGAGLAVLGGTFLYNGSGGSFVEAANAAKLPDYVVQIADRLLEVDEHPRVIAQDPIGVYIRQYSGEIDSLFGRDIGGYIKWPDEVVWNVFREISNTENELKNVSQLMVDEGYKYLVLQENDRNLDGFQLFDRIAGFQILKSTSNPVVKKERNELGQVIRTTTVDEEGNPINGEDGFATIVRDYDSYGNVIYELHLDAGGECVANDIGIAGFNKEFNEEGELLTESTLGADGLPIMAFQNYAVTRHEYKDHKNVKVSYYDENYQPILQEAGYVAYRQEWDGDELWSRTYLDIDGKVADRIDGYSKATWIDGNVTFYDSMGNEVPLEGINLIKDIQIDSAGWSKWMTPKRDVIGSYFSLGQISLGKKETGDSYCCQIEIEFKNVTSTPNQPFLFETLGAVDNGWSINNIWYPNVAYLNNVPEDGIYTFSSVVSLNSSQAKAKWFEICFRCDNWGSGSFRIRRIKIEKGNQPSEWTPGI